tara:strand:- start:164 stop:451 length:288 start_codon:yes stop_codon:yes gene_type:complete
MKFTINQKIELQWEVEAKSAAAAKRIVDSIALNIGAKEKLPEDIIGAYITIKDAQFWFVDCPKCFGPKFRIKLDYCHRCRAIFEKKERARKEAVQ